MSAPMSLMAHLAVLLEQHGPQAVLEALRDCADVCNDVVAVPGYHALARKISFAASEATRMAQASGISLADGAQVLSQDVVCDRHDDCQACEDLGRACLDRSIVSLAS